MEEKYLVINGGSSSLKFSLYSMPAEIIIAKGYIEKIGFKDSFWNLIYGDKKLTNSVYLKDHNDAVKVMMDELFNNGIIMDISEIKCIGHRVLHGGEIYGKSVLIDDEVLSDIKDLTNLGPLHHPGEIAGIVAMKQYLSDIPQVAVFDTAFHQTIPKENYMYAVPYEWYLNNKVRKYGFHGTSHKYITLKMSEILGRENVNLIICHVGSGASVTCIRDGKSFDTSMGLTPLDGLVMGTRSGSIDPSIIQFMIDETGMNLTDVMNDLNRNSGLKGICGKNDFRDVIKLIHDGNSEAKLAYDVFMDSIIKYIAEYYFELEGNVDAIVFTAGVLENNPVLRGDIVNKISSSLNITLDTNINDNIGAGRDNKSGIITTNKSRIPVYVIPTDEELMIVKDCYNIVREI